MLNLKTQLQTKDNEKMEITPPAPPTPPNSVVYFVMPLWNSFDCDKWDFMSVLEIVYFACLKAILWGVDW